jgi:hypothetical protein
MPPIAVFSQEEQQDEVRDTMLALLSSQKMPDLRF